MSVNARTSECDLDQVEAFLSEHLTAVQEEQFTAHLTVCERCRRTLEQQAAEPDAWADAAKFLATDTSGPPQTNGAMHAGAAPPPAGPQRQPPPLVRAALAALAPTDDPRMLGRIGAYEVCGVVGSGGMGVVLKAVDPSLDRIVAVKVLAPHLATGGAARKRFAREARAAAAVLHPNVIAIHSVSNDGPLPYLVMPFVRGTSLQKRLDAEGPLALHETLRIGAQVAAGLAAAHAQGLVHRDIKPANILLEDGVERVTITDFGLARAVDDATITYSGTIAGTPQYMSPEQARGEAVGQASDLFSLGSVLYAACTGRPPFRAEATYAVIRRIADDEPTPVREINPDVPDWLASVVVRLMAKRPEDRYGSAAEVAELLERCLAHVQQPGAVALPASLVPRPASRRRALGSRTKGVIAMFAMLGVVLLGTVLWQASDAPEPRPKEAGTAPKGAGAVPSGGTTAATEAEVVPKFEGHRSFAGSVSTLAYSPNYKRMAFAHAGRTTAATPDSGTPTVDVMDAWTGKPVSSPKLTTTDEDTMLAEARRTPPFEVGALAISPDGTVVAVGTSVGQVKLFDALTGELIRSHDDEQVRAADKETPENLRSFKRAMGSVRSLAFSPDGNWLAACGGSIADVRLVNDAVERERRPGRATNAPGRLKVWDLKTGALKHDLIGHSHANAVAFSPDGKLLASAGSWSTEGENGTGVILWDPVTGKKVRTIAVTANGGTRAVAFSPDGKLLAYGSQRFDKDADTSQGVVGLVRVGSGIAEWQQTLPGWARPVAFMPDGKSVVALCGGPSVRLLDAETGRPKLEIRPADAAKALRWNDLVVAPTGHRIVIGGVDNERNGTIEYWSVEGPVTAADPAPATRVAPANDVNLLTPKDAAKSFQAALLRGDAAGAQRCVLDQPGHREAAAVLARFSATVARLEEACQKRFKTSLASSGNPRVTLALPDPNGASYATVTGDEKYATVSWPGRKDDPLRLTKVGDEWRVDMTDEKHRTAEDLQRLAAKADAIDKALAGVQQKLDAGRLATVQDLRWAFLGAMVDTNYAEVKVEVKSLPSKDAAGK